MITVNSRSIVDRDQGYRSLIIVSAVGRLSARTNCARLAFDRLEWYRTRHITCVLMWTDTSFGGAEESLAICLQQKHIGVAGHGVFLPCCPTTRSITDLISNLASLVSVLLQPFTHSKK